ncbi:MAG: SPOR domain-containing protein [Terriglobales bacterium]
MDENQEHEKTTGTGRLLFLFLGMVALCAVFFGLGYSLGKNSIPAAIQAAEPIPAATGGGAKPSPLNVGDSAVQTPSSDQLTFYKSVEQKDQQPGLAEKPPSPAETKLETAPAAAGEEARLAAAAGMTPVAATAPASGYTVQIAAVTRKEDADALVAALRKKQYPVFVATSASDKFLRVQVGPFSDPKEAETMRQRLIGDGYKPILKK